MTSRTITLAAVLGLLLLLGAWLCWWVPPARAPGWLVLLVHALPLAPGLTLLLRQRPGAVLVTAYGALLPFSLGVMEAWVNPAARVPALLEVGLTLLVIGAACWAGLRRRFGARAKV